MMSGVMIALEFSAPEMRPTYIGLSNTIYGIAAAIAPLAGSWLAETTGYGWLFGLSAASALAGLTLLHWLVREPRLVEKRW
jgi:MFS family permease